MPVDIHAFMQDTDDDETVVSEAVEHHVRTRWIFEVPVTNIDRTPGFSARRQALEHVNDVVVIAIRLLQGPGLEGIKPNLLPFFWLKLLPEPFHGL